MGETAHDAVLGYVEHTPGVAFDLLRFAFPRSAHGNREVIEVEVDNLDMRRFSLPIILEDGTSVLVTNQWCGAGPHENWQRYCDHVAHLDREGLSIRIEPNGEWRRYKLAADIITDSK